MLPLPPGQRTASASSLLGTPATFLFSSSSAKCYLKILYLLAIYQLFLFYLWQKEVTFVLIQVAVLNSERLLKQETFQYSTKSSDFLSHAHAPDTSIDGRSSILYTPIIINLFLCVFLLCF